MSLSLFVRRIAVCLCSGLFLAIPAAAFAQTNIYTANGTEYAIIGLLPGDQVFPDAAVNTNGGFVVWQDNITDGNGWGISARQVDDTLSGTLGTFRVNQQDAGDQENPRVALLKNGGAVFVWQGGSADMQHIFAAFLNSNNVFVNTNDVLVNTLTTNMTYSYATNVTTTITTNWDAHHLNITGYTTNTTKTVTTNATGNTVGFQITPAVAVLNNSNVVFVWASYDEASSNSLEDIYGRIFSQTGQPLTGEFLINQFTPYNQQTPSVAALENGGFAVSWTSDQERTIATVSPNPILPGQIVNPSVDVYARLYNGGGVPQGNEFLVNTDSNPCATPAVAAASDGSFMIVWGARDMVNPTNGLDIFARSFSSAGVGGTVVRVNSYTYGDQYAPQINSIGTNYLIAWTSLGQDGPGAGVYGQFLQSNGSAVGGNFLVNATNINQQIEPVVASDGVSQFLVVWTGFTGVQDGFDLFAQRYINASAPLEPMSTPYVYAPFVISNGVYQPQLQVSWAPMPGISVSNYEVYVDGSAMPVALVTSNQWTMTAANGLTTTTTYTFQLDYVTTGGLRSPGSPVVSASTWSGLNWQGIPYEWMAQYFGSDTNTWPPASADSDGDGMNNLQEFLAGTSPTDPASVLRVQLTQTPGGMFLGWPTQPGFTYQVQITTDFVNWTNLGDPRFAAGTSDSIFVGSASSGYYRILLLRQ